MDRLVFHTQGLDTELQIADRLVSLAKNVKKGIRKSVIGSNIHIEVNTFRLTLDHILILFTAFRLLV